MLRIGLTGGIGAGKSSVARMLAERGAVVIDADQISRELVEPGAPALEALVAEFGQEILQPDGTLSRAQLAAIAFRDGGATQRLNAIMHPRIRDEAERRIAEHPEAAVVVYDMPLLVETGQQDLVDIVLVVDVPEETQVERAVEFRGLDRDDVQRRMGVQASRSERAAVADVTISNDGSPEETARQVDQFWADLLQREKDSS